MYICIYRERDRQKIMIITFVPLVWFIGKFRIGDAPSRGTLRRGCRI